MDWSTGKDRERDKEAEVQKAAERKANFEAVSALLKKYKEDDLLQNDLRHPEVLRAIDHWTGRKRLEYDEAEKWQEDYRVMNVLDKIRLLQTVSATAGIPVPLAALLAGQTDPLYGALSTTKSHKQEDKSKDREPGRLEERGEREEEKTGSPMKRVKNRKEKGKEQQQKQKEASQSSPPPAGPPQGQEPEPQQMSSTMRLIMQILPIVLFFLVRWVMTNIVPIGNQQPDLTPEELARLEKDD